MTMHKPRRVWSVADAQANLEEVLRLSETEGPQYIDAGKTFAVEPVKDGEQQQEQRLPLGRWLVENMPRGTNLVVPEDRGSKRIIPFNDETDE